MSIKNDHSRHYRELLPRFREIAKEDFAPINIPYPEAISEGYRMIKVCERDRDELIAAGITAGCIDGLKARVIAFTDCVMECDCFSESVTHTEVEWRTLKAEGYALRRHMLQACRYAFYGHASALERLVNIHNGRGDRVMIQDLVSLAMLTEEQRPLLESINFDFTLSAKARELHGRLVECLTRRTINSGDSDAPVRIRNAAWTYLNESLQQLYRAGRYVFTDQPERRKDYYIYYLQERSRNNKNAASSRKRSQKDSDPSLKIRYNLPSGLK